MHLDITFDALANGGGHLPVARRNVAWLMPSPVQPGIKRGVEMDRAAKVWYHDGLAD